MLASLLRERQNGVHPRQKVLLKSVFNAVFAIKNRMGKEPPDLYLSNPENKLAVVGQSRIVSTGTAS